MQLERVHVGFITSEKKIKRSAISTLNPWIVIVDFAVSQSVSRSNSSSLKIEKLELSANLDCTFDM